ncbi:hypothetical protein H7F51_01325 [Novosphingobium flavum]|uniref:Uncharacterized protein n=1 Tax=Novosphingobium flavum TaxID=1778672 RepID=A0A7X1KK50_9SPHN|nr:hypothetical protein [Novosphingobium flavum]MBC2664152.1 hypothetical protein [Novosphingobium flavum]
MIALVKALIPGAFLSWIISTFIGTRGGSGGLLHIQHFNVQGTEIYGSWTLFIIGTAIAWALLMMME